MYSRIILLASLSACALLANPVYGQTITVDTFVDQFDVVADGQCALREAIESINTNTSFGGCTNPGGADTIALGPGTFVLDISSGVGPANSSGGVRILAPTTVQGAGSGQTTIQGDPGLGSDLIEIGVGSGDDVTLMDFTVENSQDGSAIDFFPADDGTVVTLANLVVRDNASPFSGAGLNIQGDRNVTIRVERSVFENNTAGFGGGAIDCRNDGDVEVNLILLDVLFRDNRAVADSISPDPLGGGNSRGGAVLLSGCDATIENVTFDSNRADNGGGLFVGDYFDADATVTLTNVTFFGNIALTGGGTFINFEALSGSALSTQLTNVTFADNNATTGGGLFSNNSSSEATNLLFGGNTGGDCDGNPVINFNSGGGNRDSDGTCGFVGAGDTTGPGGLAAALSNEGGFTPVLALLAGSPALDLGNNATCPPGTSAV